MGIAPYGTARDTLSAREHWRGGSVSPLPPSAREVAARSADGGRDKNRYFSPPVGCADSPLTEGALQCGTAALETMAPSGNGGVLRAGRPTRRRAPLIRSKARIQQGTGDYENRNHLHRRTSRLRRLKNAPTRSPLKRQPLGDGEQAPSGSA